MDDPFLANTVTILNDIQVGGTHYRESSIQTWDIGQDWYTGEEFQCYLTLNIIKYLQRYRKKGGVDDLRKARHYLEKLISVA